MQELTQAQLKELLSYDPETGVFTWLNGKLAGKKAGPNSNGYLFIGINNKSYSQHRLAWLYVYGLFPIKVIDHINGIISDNRICNLRECSDLENSWNAGVGRGNTSGFKGVSWHKPPNNKWRAQIKVFGKNILIGSYQTAELASAAYQAKARELHGEFYRAPVVKA